MFRKLHARLQLACFSVVSVTAAAENRPDIVIAKPGSNVTLWKGWNVSGKSYLNISGAGSDNCVRAWWIIMGVNKNVGTLCGKTQRPLGNLPDDLLTPWSIYFDRSPRREVCARTKLDFSAKMCSS